MRWDCVEPRFLKIARRCGLLNIAGLCATQRSFLTEALEVINIIT
jgi:hypothetical protein